MAARHAPTSRSSTSDRGTCHRLARHLLRVPGVREIVTWNLWMVLRKRS